jgi:hypothetical protein
MTSERDCGSQPCDRSPSTALHHGGFGVVLHDFTGDCPIAGNATIAATAIATRPHNSHSFLQAFIPFLSSFVIYKRTSGESCTNAGWLADSDAIQRRRCDCDLGQKESLPMNPGMSKKWDLSVRRLFFLGAPLPNFAVQYLKHEFSNIKRGTLCLEGELVNCPRSRPVDADS